MLNPPTRKPKSEEKMPIREIENYCETLRARHVFYSRIHFGGNAVSIHLHGAPCAHGNPTTMHRETRTGGAKRKERGAQQAVRAH